MADPAGSFLNAFLRGATSGQNQGSGVADLNQFEQIANQNSLYNMIAGPVLGTRFNTSTWSPTQSAGVSLGQSLLGSFLSGMGKNDVANQMQAITQAMPSIYENPSAAVRPEGVDTEAFNTFAGALQRDKIQKAAEDTSFKNRLAAEEDSAINRMFATQKAKGSKKVEIPAPVLEGLSKSKSVIDEANSIANVLKSGATSWGDLQLAKNLGAADTEGVGLRLKNLVDILGKSRSGAALTKAEEKMYSDLITGGLPSSPAQVANLLEKLSQAESRMAKSKLDLFESYQGGGIEGLKSSFDAPTTSAGGVPSVGGTFNGEKVLSVRKIK